MNGFGAVQNQVGLAEPPTCCELWLRWQIGWVAFDAAPCATQRWMRSICGL